MTNESVPAPCPVPISVPAFTLLPPLPLLPFLLPPPPPLLYLHLAVLASAILAGCSTQPHAGVHFAPRISLFPPAFTPSPPKTAQRNQTTPLPATAMSLLCSFQLLPSTTAVLGTSRSPPPPSIPDQIPPTDLNTKPGPYLRLQCLCCAPSSCSPPPPQS
jgi:hypothetical protein